MDDLESYERLVKADELQAEAERHFSHQRVFAVLLASLVMLIALAVFALGFVALNRDTETIKKAQNQAAMAQEQARRAGAIASRNGRVTSCLAIYVTARDGWADASTLFWLRSDYFGTLRAVANAIEVDRRRAGVAILAHARHRFACPDIPRHLRFPPLLPPGTPRAIATSDDEVDHVVASVPTAPTEASPPPAPPPTQAPRAPPPTRPRPNCPGNSPPPCPRPDPQPHHGRSGVLRSVHA